MDASVFSTLGDSRFVATELGRGPWDPGALHGGAPAALLMRQFERLLPEGADLALARVTYEILRPVPLGELSVSAEVTRPGRRVQLMDGVVLAPDGIEVVRARALAVRPADAPPSSQSQLPGVPGDGGPNDFKAPYQPMFTPDAIEIRFVSGGFHNGGRSVGWFRLRVPIVAGEEPSGLQRLAAAADFGNGISAALPWNEYVFINPDLTLYIERGPFGEWIGLEAVTRIAEGGIGVSESVLYDERGRVGRAMQALYVARRGPGSYSASRPRR